MTTDLTPSAAAVEEVPSSIMVRGFAGYLDRALAGEHFVVSRNGGRPAAALVPFGWWQAKSAPTAGHTPNMRDTAGKPVPLDGYARHLRATLESPYSREQVEVSRGDVEAAASLLDELSALYPGEDFGRLAREIAVRLYDRSGV